jgi:hypothetical protein
MKSTIPTLVLLDPALREFGGHHPSLITTLSQTKAMTDNEFKLLIYANESCAAELIEKLSITNNVMVNKYFKTDFYQHFYSNAKVSTFNAYIQVLVKEYFYIFEKHKASVTTFYYHTLNWEHAYALALAIKLFNNKYELQHKHIVCLMYNPCKFQKANGEITDIENKAYEAKGNNQYNNIDQDRYFKFSLGFRLLGKHDNVSFFATEYELTAHYESILERTIDWCPCSLISNTHLDDIKTKFRPDFRHELNDKSHHAAATKKNSNVLLYLGDAKVNKGFLALPDMLENLTKNITNKKVTFTIQYTLTNNDKNLVRTHQKLQKISKFETRVVIVNNFLSDEKMHQLLLKTTDIVFNYNERDYSNQSSGVLWLAAAYKMNIYLLTKTWLNREAERLNCNYYLPCNKKKLVEHLNEQTSETVNLNKIIQPNLTMKIEKKPTENYTANVEFAPYRIKRIELYQSRLFSDVGNWLNEKLISKDNARWKI